MKTEHSSRPESVLNKRSNVRYLTRMCISGNTRHVYCSSQSFFDDFRFRCCNVVAGTSQQLVENYLCNSRSRCRLTSEGLKMHFKLDHSAVFGP